VGAAIHRALRSERLLRCDDGNMWRPEQPVVLETLFGVGFPITARRADSLVEPEAAGPPPFEISATIFTRKGHVRSRGILRDVVAQRRAKALGGGAFGDDHLPWLGIAPRWRALRNAQDSRDQVVVNWIKQEPPTTNKLRSYGAAKAELSARHEQGLRKNNGGVRPIFRAVPCCGSFGP